MYVTARHSNEALVATFPNLCFLVQSATTITKVRETFWHLVCPYLLRDWRVVGGHRSSQSWLGPGLVRVVCA